LELPLMKIAGDVEYSNNLILYYNKHIQMTIRKNSP
jgi:hypothetical protein